MCGICGIFSSGSAVSKSDVVWLMADRLRHRGPDAGDIWEDAASGLAVAHRRLSIVDLSPAGAQPMESHCGRYILVFNGEIYNHVKLRRSLEDLGAAPTWRGVSDTETLLAVIKHWGLWEGLKRSYGMFALALWDKQTQELHFARDRMGEKPLYLARLPDGWAFASELKPLLSIPNFKAKLSKTAIASYLAYGYVPDNECIFDDVQKIKPGCVVSLSSDNLIPVTRSYETFGALVESSKTEGSSERMTVDKIENILGNVVEEQMLSDVPLGCFLSGGIDSSLVASLMQARSSSCVNTFAIGFQEERFDEAPHAAAVARHLGTEHTEYCLAQDEALEVVSDLPKIYDEPFADSSQIATVLLCREARSEVTVALTGDGGDEVFGGYNRHVIGPSLLEKLQRVPKPVRKSVGHIAARALPFFLEEDRWPRRLSQSFGFPVTALDNAAKISSSLGEIDSLPSLYRNFTRGIQDPEFFLRSKTGATQHVDEFSLAGSEWLMAMDSTGYLPGDILVKVDRAAMAASLETRAPLLDARVVSAAWELPLEMKIHHRKGKRALREILYKYVPEDLIDRPKQGFAIPLDSWLRGALKNWGESLISDSELVELSDLEGEKIFQLWHAHQLGKINNGKKLWTILMFLAWLKEYRYYVQSGQNSDELVRCSAEKF